MLLLLRLLRRLGIRREPTSLRHYQVENGFLAIISELAQQEQRPEEEIHADLLADAIARRNITHEIWDRWQSLSPREQEVTALTCLGYTNYQIAAKLGVSHTTIKTHIRNILIKFQLHGKGELRMALQDWDFREWDRLPHN
jgi:DNA-binding CsgD family transcriptional regulator